MRKHSGPAGEKCPIAYALDAYGDKWTLLILRDMLFKGKRHYGDFLASAEGISTNILAQRLQQLTGDGLITQEVDPDNHAKRRYQLTPKGQDVLPLLLEMTAWSARYNPQPDAPSNLISGAPANLLRRLERDREALIDEIVHDASSPRLQ